MTIQDPRYLNHIFEANTPADYYRDYTQSLSRALASLDTKLLDQACELIMTTAQRGRRIFLAGNGGSAAIADHLSCDLGKGTLSPGQPPIKVMSLSANGPILTAIANDYGYEQVFATQLEMYAQEGDVLITISSSGNSPNICKALEKAKAMKVKTIALTGFSGGKCKALADLPLHFEFKNYGIVEDCHQIVLQCLGQILAKLRDEAGSKA
ncbi:MAG: SIS domain-containing protein [Bdellovibrionales bacterium]|nr:SIS domain-containing protein [Bdellovibrionales bacterium]